MSKSGYRLELNWRGLRDTDGDLGAVDISPAMTEEAAKKRLAEIQEKEDIPVKADAWALSQLAVDPEWLIDESGKVYKNI